MGTVVKLVRQTTFKGARFAKCPDSVIRDVFLRVGPLNTHTHDGLFTAKEPFIWIFDMTKYNKVVTTPLLTRHLIKRAKKVALDV